MPSSLLAAVTALTLGAPQAVPPSPTPLPAGEVLWDRRKPELPEVLAEAPAR